MLLGQSSQDKIQSLKGRVKCLAATQTGNRRQDGGREGRVGKEKPDAGQQDITPRQNGCFRNQWFEPYNHQPNFQK